MIGVAFISVLAGCRSSPPEIRVFVALGDSLTAGYQGGSFDGTQQSLSFPNIVARQLGISEFRQPLLSDPTRPGPFHNLGIPGASLETALDPYGPTGRGPNPYFDLVLRGRGNALDQALSLEPDLIAIWFGNNEILWGVISGGARAEETVFSPESFAGLLDKALKAIRRSGAKIALANVIDLCEIPFVTALPTYALDQKTGEPLRGSDGQVVPLLGPEGCLSSGWSVTLSALSLLEQGFGVAQELGGNGIPLSDEVTLSPAEKRSMRDLVVRYNRIIADAASQTGTVLVDIHGLFEGLRDRGLPVEGRAYTHAVPWAGLFSADGIHPTPLGYALIANAFIADINREFGLRVPEYTLHEVLQ